MKTCFDLLLDVLPSPISVKDDHGVCIFRNRAYIEYFGQHEKSVRGSSLRETDPLTRQRDQDTLRTGTSSEFEKVIRGQSGESRDFRVLRSLFRDQASGRFLVTSFEDLSDKNKILRELEDSRLRQVETARLASIGRMTAEIAHEINNPLMIIMGKTWMARQKIKDAGFVQADEVTSYFEKIENHAGRISKIVKSLRTFSRDGRNDSKTAVAVKEAILDAFTLCHERFQQHGVNLSLTEGSDSLFAFCHPVQITQVLLNLLSNAFDAVEGRPCREVHVSVHSAGGFVEVAVTDSGPGVDKDKAEKIFEPFFTTKGPRQGTGLGLSISSEIAMNNGGTLVLESLHPCRFVLRLPEIPVTGLELDFVV